MIFISDMSQHLFISRLKILESSNCVQFGGRNVARNVITLIRSPASIDTQSIIVLIKMDQYLSKSESNFRRCMYLLLCLI